MVTLKKNVVCPWQQVKYLDNFLRPYIHDTSKLFGPYVRPGMTALDVGCGRGFATIGLARLVGEGGSVISADVQPEMLDMVAARAHDAGLSRRTRTHLARPGRIGVKGPVDFAVAFFMLHEVPDQEAFLAEISSVMRPGGHFFVAEPLFHTTRRYFAHMIGRAEAVGFVPVDFPGVFFGRAVVFRKEAGSNVRRGVQ